MGQVLVYSSSNMDVHVCMRRHDITCLYIYSISHAVALNTYRYVYVQSLYYDMIHVNVMVGLIIIQYYNGISGSNFFGTLLAHLDFSYDK